MLLDDIGRAMYKKLKSESDSLLRMQSAIKSKRKMLRVLEEEWLRLEGEELDEDADKMYAEKCKVEAELVNLERGERESLERIRRYAYKKA